MKVEYNGYTLEIEEVKDDKGSTDYYTASCAELPYFPSGIFKTDLAFIISYFKRTVHAYTFNQLNKKEEEQMKTFNIEYKGYVLEVETVPASQDGGYSYTVGTCASISFFRNGNYIDYSQIIDSFIKNVNQITKNKEDKFVNFSDPSDVELRVLYKGKTLYIGSYDLDKKTVDITKTNFGLKSGTSDKLDELVEQFMQYINKDEQMKKLTIEYQNYKLEVEIHPINFTLLIPYIKGTCDCISFVKDGYYKNEDYSEIINSFMKDVDLLTESKKEDTSHTHLLTQLDRLAKKDKETNFTPFELRGQLVEIYHLFGKILSLTLEDIHKLYFTRAEGEN